MLTTSFCQLENKNVHKHITYNPQHSAHYTRSKSASCILKVHQVQNKYSNGTQWIKLHDRLSRNNLNIKVHWKCALIYKTFLSTFLPKQSLKRVIVKRGVNNIGHWTLADMLSIFTPWPHKQHQKHAPQSV